ncbi:kinase-like protein [Durotheca rogersii]|uniref:kinase-like protein n=1 Tax=Durotheca rogersii TaxID=419775 RepID=UPI00221FF67A|nr:kinase-like protein [Durotheca rogersii]KAI5868336.1 kinase-like protein [Durotheca rogersii]
MAPDADWKASLTSSDRYDTIQAIKAALDKSDAQDLSSQKTAFEIENEAYQASASREEYEKACQAVLSLGAPAAPAASLEPPAPPASQIRPESPDAKTIGHYHDCRYVDSGVTADVYRSGAVALKVIVDTSPTEPHNPTREAKILKLLKKPCIPLLETFRDRERRFVLVFPFLPLSLGSLAAQGPIPRPRIRKLFADLFDALDHLHQQGIIHRDVKPAALLLASPDGPAYLSDFGTAWHPELSTSSEPRDGKILDIGTGPYRAPEALFGDRSYGASVDMWAAGAMLAECCRAWPRPLFESRAVHEDGNQLGLILSIFKTIGSPTRESWPQAESFRTPPFDMYQVFTGRAWEDLLPDVDEDFRELVAALVMYNTNTRATASQALKFKCMLDHPGHD